MLFAGIHETIRTSGLPLKRRKLGEFYHDTDIMLRSYVSDEFDFRYIEQDYEKRDKSSVRSSFKRSALAIVLEI